MKRFIPLIAAVVLVFVLIFVMHRLDKAAPAEHEDEETQASQTAPKAAPAAAANSGSELLPEEMVGSPGAKYKFTVGWYYDETNQPDTKPLQDALQAVKTVVRQSDGTMSVEIVDVDVPLEDRSPAARGVMKPGIALNGGMRPEFSGNPGHGMLVAPNFSHIMPFLSQGK